MLKMCADGAKLSVDIRNKLQAGYVLLTVGNASMENVAGGPFGLALAVSLSDYLVSWSKNMNNTIFYKVFDFFAIRDHMR